jgi:hypothetical protein
MQKALSFVVMNAGLPILDQVVPASMDVQWIPG